MLTSDRHVFFYSSTSLSSDSAAHQGHVLLRASSVTINPNKDWHALLSDMKWQKTGLSRHLWICCKICPGKKKKRRKEWKQRFLSRGLFIHVAHQHSPHKHGLLQIWGRCDLKGHCLCFLIQLMEKHKSPREKKGGPVWTITADWRSGGSSNGEQLSTKAIWTDFFNHGGCQEMTFLFQELLSHSHLCDFICLYCKLRWI